MNYCGDIPDGDREVFEELKVMERFLFSKKDSLPSMLMAKGCVSISHDYVFIHLEEEAERLLKLAEECCPGYLSAEIFIHMDNDPTFAYLVQRILTDPIGSEVITAVANKHEPL